MTTSFGATRQFENVFWNSGMDLTPSASKLDRRGATSSATSTITTVSSQLPMHREKQVSVQAGNLVFATPTILGKAVWGSS